MKFEVGDSVLCYEKDLAENNGKIGEIIHIHSARDMDWPLDVCFDGGFVWSYTLDGYRIDETQPSNRIEPATKLHKLLAGLE